MFASVGRGGLSSGVAPLWYAERRRSVNRTAKDDFAWQVPGFLLGSGQQDKVEIVGKSRVIRVKSNWRPTMTEIRHQSHLVRRPL